MTAVVLVSDEGLGGVVPFGRAIRDSGRVPLLLTGPMQADRVERWRAVYERITVIGDPYDAHELAIAATALAGDEPLAGLFSCYDGLVVPAARAAAALGLPHPSVEGLERCRNKHLTRVATAARGLRVPRCGLVASEDDLDRVALDVGFPAVIKPLNGLASHLVRRVDGPRELAAAYAHLASRIERSYRGNYANPLRGGLDGEPSVDPRSTFLVEEFVEGDEYSAEIVVRNGQPHRVALLHKFMVDPDGFLECGFTTPSAPPEREEALWRHIEQSLDALGVDDCVAHVEVLDAPGGPVLIEVNAARPGGQIIVRAVQDAFGVDLIRETLAVQCGDPRPEPLEPVLGGRVTTLSVFPPGSGVLERLEGIDDAAALPGVLEVLPFCAEGDYLDMEDKELFAVNLLVAGVDPPRAAELYDEARRLVRFQLSPNGTAPPADPAQPEREVRADPARLDAIIERSLFLRWLRARLERAGFLEMQTPLLHVYAECGDVQQYALTAANGRTLYLRTDPEEYLKRYVTAGVDAVFEIATNVRGESPDQRRLHEFTSLECYRKGWSFDEVLDFAWSLIVDAVTELRGSTQTLVEGVPVDLGHPPAVRAFGDIVRERAGIDVFAHPTAEGLLGELRARGLWEGTGGPLDAWRRTSIEWLLESCVVPSIEEPTFVVDFPSELALNALVRPERPEVSLRSELFLPGGYELANLYENLVEPAELRARYSERIRHRVQAGLPEVPLDEGLMASTELGMPAMAGFAMGADRLFALIRGSGVVGDGLLFAREGFDGSWD